MQRNTPDYSLPLPEEPDGAPTFANPWQARAFALAVALNEAEHLDWPSWSRLLGDEIARRTPAGSDMSASDDAYYECWIAALEKACGGMETPPGSFSPAQK
jgi:nitrile hydratase accessory protein